MPNDDREPHALIPLSTTENAAVLPKRSIWSLPPPVKRVFDKFPLVTYEANELPARAPKKRQKHVLHVFTTKEDAESGRPSFNPGCLKWQTYLRFAGLELETVVSSNHASPTGVLPFLQPATPATDPVAGNKMRKWLEAREEVRGIKEPEDVRYKVYMSLLDHRVRKAWLYQLYLDPRNRDLVHSLYVAPCSTQGFVQMAITRQLREAASVEMVKSAGSTDVSTLDLVHDAEEAFEALSVLLGDEDWFFGLVEPSLFDASVFAYTCLILDRNMGWKHNPLIEILAKHDNLVQHRKRILKEYF
ncbi:hypothetical protein DOTSEDRAFT_85352 [Dothistroma septosporum NZE10]|uniref:Thioredoxin-like fold domain-containing protein n=1 Tax=Dothistroma septosporum (strain NZE10 / CBS 128990) TaxID=675120 RepID=N1Q372_DOTSN|nr:hypothetical protein DOTSEDRAFT_85352 [Dothistroma septosporum NZE10]